MSVPSSSNTGEPNVLSEGDQTVGRLLPKETGTPVEVATQLSPSESTWALYREQLQQATSQSERDRIMDLAEREADVATRLLPKLEVPKHLRS